jgi:hypothetical protein
VLTLRSSLAGKLRRRDARKGPFRAGRGGHEPAAGRPRAPPLPVACRTAPYFLEPGRGTRPPRPTGRWHPCPTLSGAQC